ncbi:MAG: KAP family P-loop NTPase fold protein [Solirubrobacteraceae bacterium]
MAAVIAIFVKLAGEGLTVKSTRSAPSSDEEFERLFRTLVDKVKAKRLVIFVDELDRCSPEQVASALETIKTFLEVPGCIFIVAADLQVLEQALRKEARQETPSDPANPYYSTGSSYLDKIFQYQLSLPPLRSPRLTSFALALVAEREGCWQRAENLPEAISVLIASHISSPRRVKVLLNSYAMTYRLAERRERDGLLAANLASRASEVAKLVCLRCEFPLFAAALSREPRLPSLVRAIAEQEAPPSTVSADVLALADDYAHGRLPVAELMIDQTTVAPVSPPDPPSPSDLEPAPVAAEEALDAQVQMASAEQAAATTVTQGSPSVEQAHALQLVRYLRKVAYIPDPGRDLIYLESAGADLGLDPGIAERLESAARDRATDEVLALTAPLGPEDLRAALLLLAALVREEPAGVEGANAASMLLLAVTQGTIDLDGVADEVADAIAGHQARVSLRPQDMAGALAVGLACARHYGARLREQVLGDQQALARSDVAAVAVRGLARIPGSFETALGTAATTLLIDGTGTLTQLLLALTDEQAARVLEQARAPLKAALADRTEEQLTALEAEMVEMLQNILGTRREPLVTSTFALALSTEAVQFRRAVDRYRAKLDPVSDPELISLLLAAAPNWYPDHWNVWLTGIDAANAAKIPNAAELMAAAAGSLWRHAWAEQPPEKLKEIRTIGPAALGALAGHGVPVDHAKVLDAMRNRLDGAFTTNAAAESQRDALQVAGSFVDAKLLDRRSLSDLDLDCCVTTFQTPLPPETPGEWEQVPPAAYTRVLVAAASASAESLTALRDAVAASPWLGEDRRANLTLAVAAALHGLDAATSSPFTAEQVATLMQQHGAGFHDGAAIWLSTFAATPTDAWTAFAHTATIEPPEELSEALRLYSRGLSAKGKLELVAPTLENAFSAPPSASFLKAVRFTEVDQREASALIITLAAEATDEQRPVALMLWHQLNPSSEPTRNRLVQKIYLPLVRSGPSGVDLALEHFGLVSTLRGQQRQQVTDALREHASGETQQRRVDERLKDAGWLKRSLFGLGPLVDNDY